MSHYRGTRRNTTRGTLITRAGNRLLNPCPTCDAKRYERCFNLRIATDPETGVTDTYPVILDDPHERRLITLMEVADDDRDN